MDRFFSHAEEVGGIRKGSKLLKEHHEEVGVLMKTNCFKIDAEIAYLVGIAHDFGKYTSFFQEYLLYNQNAESIKHHHGFISALFSAYICNGKDSEFGRYLPLIAYFVVLHHHGDLYALELDVVRASELKEKDFLGVNTRWRERLKVVITQVEDIKKKQDIILSEYHNLLNNLKIEDFLDNWLEVFGNLWKLSYRLRNEEKEDIRLKIFVLTLYLYSLLIDADKRSAGRVIKSIKRYNIPSDMVDTYRNNSPKIDTTATSGINGIRNEIYTKVTSKILKESLDNHIFTITAPTGTGKTLTSFSCALKLRERISKEKGYTPRIIYSLPFISVIEQNYEVFKDVFQHSLQADFSRDENRYLIKHHHLADIRYKAENEEKPIDESLLLIESWDAEVIVTTFIQLLHSIIGFKNRFLKKYHNIARSIILLDEVQNIPVEYWLLINKVFNLLTKYLDCYIILLTATRPLIFDPEEAIELLDNAEGYFQSDELNRVRLLPDKRILSLEDFIDEFRKIYNTKNSYLIVLNTINSSINVYNEIKKLIKDQDRISYLSTNIIPKERAKRIKDIKDALKNKEKIIVVSTQVVEAGVDINLDVVVRDIGPIDSIIQVAGRCNREGKEKKGMVYVFNLKGNYGVYSKRIYGAVHYGVACNLLENKLVEEVEFFELINQYFESIVSKKSQKRSSNIVDAITQFRFHHPNMEEKSISGFNLIEENPGYVDVFIELNNEAKEVWSKYTQCVLKETDFKRRQESYFSIQKELNSYIISIPKTLTRGLEQVGEYLFRLPYERYELDYDKETGFKRIEEGSLIF
jgi:CRISPR-associated endonuclease/helicase Cas3